MDARIRAIIHRGIHSNPLHKSVEQISLDMTAALGLRVTEHMLYDFSAPSRTHRFPLAWLGAFMESTGDHSLLDALLDALGSPLAGQLSLAEYGKAQLEADLAAEQAAGLKAQILRGKL